MALCSYVDLIGHAVLLFYFILTITFSKFFYFVGTQLKLRWQGYQLGLCTDIQLLPFALASSNAEVFVSLRI